MSTAIDSRDHRVTAIRRAILQYGESPHVSAEKRTVGTLQGREETGFIVGGRAYGGDYLGCVFPTTSQAQAAICLASSLEAD